MLELGNDRMRHGIQMTGKVLHQFVAYIVCKLCTKLQVLIYLNLQHIKRYRVPLTHHLKQSNGTFTMHKITIHLNGGLLKVAFAAPPLALASFPLLLQ